MDEGYAIIDISSDEENMADDSLDISEEWLNELFESVDVEVLEDLDVIRIADELSTQSRIKKSSPLQKESDEDCLILDGDPDKIVSVVDGKSEFADASDLLIVGEKGHLACRDYPHPRHLCVIFPFSTTPHEKHCKLCHCYVCDSRAPCIYWGYGLSITGHCHASEKDQSWKSLRSYFKLTVVSEPVKLTGIKQSNTQSFRNSQYIHRSLTTASATTNPARTIQRKRQLHNSSLGGSRAVPVKRVALNSVGSQSFSRSHVSTRLMPDESSNVYSQGRLNSDQLHRNSSQRLLCSKILQGSLRPHFASPLANGKSIPPEASSNKRDKIWGVLASIEEDLLGTDNNSRNMEEGNVSSASSLCPVLSKPSII